MIGHKIPYQNDFVFPLFSQNEAFERVVEEKYISESMGHSVSKSITDRYIANYPLETQMEYNSKLLDTEPKITADDIKNMTEDEKTAMILKLLSQK